MDRIEIKLAADEVDQKTGEFSGYGAIFGNIDAHGDVIDPGAFKASLSDWDKRGKLPPMLLQHGGGFLGGADDLLPIGQWKKMEESARGLKVDGRLFALGTERGQYLYEGLKSGALDGLSIGFRAKKFTVGTKPGEPARKLHEVELVEVSIVTFPANGKARVTGVKAADAATTIREFEDFLRDAGFSNARAKAIASHGWKAADPRDEDGADWAAGLRRNIEKLSNL